MFPIDIENKSTIENINICISIYICIYSYISSFLHHIFAIPPAENSGISKSTGWAIIEELSIRRRVRTFLVSWGQTTRVKNCYVDLSSSYEFWLPIILLDMNVIFYRNPPILERRFDCQHVGHWPPTTPQAESRQLAVNTWVLGSILRVCSWFVYNWLAKLIVLCICRHDIVAIMLSKSGVSNKCDVDPLSNSDSKSVQ